MLKRIVEELKTILAIMNIIALAGVGYSAYFQIRENTAHKKLMLEWKRETEFVLRQEISRVEHLEDGFVESKKRDDELVKSLNTMVNTVSETNQRLARIEGQLSVSLRSKFDGR